MFGMFPLMALVIIAYNAVVFFGAPLFGIEESLTAFDAQVASFSVMSGDVWALTMGDAFVTAGLALLFLEIVKSTNTGTSAIVNHGLSMMVFVVCLVEFIMLTGFGNTTFFLIMCMALLDVIAGFTVTISTARRDLGVGGGVFDA
jgi:hypothetical protein